ncbi:MAG: oligosaccharide flippase family protein, partial [Proteobacteria bacterium]|nr:oligosaccharide flippase family protein [Pseudomonadota bacterium]
MDLKPNTILAEKCEEELVVDKSQKGSYIQIMKATSLFGGVQVFNILISIIRSKFIAVLLGPAGMGIMGLLNTTLSLVIGITNFGLAKSAIKDISAAHGTKNSQRISLVITVFRKLVWITGIFGSLVVLIFSSWLSYVTFGNYDYKFAFVWISITLLFRQLSSGQLVVLQGVRKLKCLAKANLLGSTLGLLITVPLYYLLGVDGIVPAIIVTAVISLVLSWFYSRKVSINPVNITFYQTFSESKGMLSMGFMISLAGVISLIGSYLIRIFISHSGGVGQVGLFNAGFSIINMYMGLILNSMSTDYYPRLSSVANDEKRFNQTINEQAEIGFIIIAPILIIFIAFINWVIILLYSNRFVAINEMLIWASLG